MSVPYWHISVPVTASEAVCHVPSHHSIKQPLAPFPITIPLKQSCRDVLSWLLVHFGAFGWLHRTHHLVLFQMSRIVFWLTEYCAAREGRGIFYTPVSV